MIDDYSASYMNQARAYWRIGVPLPVDLHEQLAMQGIIVAEVHEQYLKEQLQKGESDGV